jgi:hypothetical protein
VHHLNLTPDFTNGQWLNYRISVGAGATVNKQRQPDHGLHLLRRHGGGESILPKAR